LIHFYKRQSHKMASLTKEELKSALISHGLSPPPASAKKEEFIAMYEEHVAPIDQDAGEFSSDDEVTLSPRKKTSQSSAKSKASSKSPKKGKKAGNSTEENSLIVGDVDVDTMDDDELRQQLQENGVDVGPIVDSTRPFYKKKLALLLRGENGLLNGSAGYSDTEPETDPEDDDQPSGVVSPQAKPLTRSDVSSSSKKSATKSVVTSEVKSGLRKRMNLTEEMNSTDIRNTPTPRRSIHSYKVTETTRQTIVRETDGTETKDTTHTLEKTESRGEDAVDGGKPSFLARYRLWIVLLVVLLAIAYLYYSRQNGDMSVDSIIKSIEQSIQGIQTAPPKKIDSAPTQKPAPPPRDLPDQGSVAGL